MKKRKFEEESDRYNKKHRANKFSEKNETMRTSYIAKIPIPSQHDIKLNLEELENTLSEIIEEIHLNNDYTSISIVLNRLCDKYMITNIEDIIFNEKERVQHDGGNVPIIKNHSSIISKNNLLIHCSVLSHSIITIADLEVLIAQENGVENYNELKLGSINKCPLILKYFNLSNNMTKKCTVTTSHVMMHLRNYLKKVESSKKNDIFAFLTYLCKNYKYESLSDLGIKIKDYSVLLETIINAENRSKQSMEYETNIIIQEFSNSFNQELKNLQTSSEFVKNVSHRLSVSSVLVKSLASVPFLDFIKSFENFLTNHSTFSSLIDSCGKSKNDEFKIQVRDFIKMLNEIRSHPPLEQTIIHIAFIYGFFSCIKDISPGQLYKILLHNKLIEPSVNTNHSKPSDSAKYKHKLDKCCEFIEKIVSPTLKDLCDFEKEQLLLDDKISLLQLICQHDKFGNKLDISHENCSKNTINKNSSCLTSDSETFLRKNVGIVPEKYIEIELCRRNQVSTLTELDINDFHSIYMNILNSDKKESSIIQDLNTFFCGYPEKNPQIFIDKLSSQQIFDIISLQDDLNSIEDKFLYFPKFATSKSSFVNLINKLKTNSLIVNKLKDEISLFSVGYERSESLIKLTLKNYSRQNFIESFVAFDALLFSNIISCEILSKQKHWDSNIYFMYGNWISEAIRIIQSKNSSRQMLECNICCFILKVLIHIDLRLAALILRKVIFQGVLILFGSIQNLCNRLWETSKTMTLSHQIILLKIGLIESVSDILTPEIINEYIGTITKPPVLTVNEASIDTLTSAILSVEATPSIACINEDKIKKTLSKNIASYSKEKCFEVIEEIRKKNFLIGATIECSILKEGLDFQMNRLGRSLEHLSSKLYSEKLHFIYEIFQNADDSFNKGFIVEDPTITLIINQFSLLIMYNENGFDQKDISSLCDVGNSSKIDSKFIGNKGIGFKSVFQISNRPEVHSNCFHICFNYEKYGALGYVMPEWIENNDHISECIEKSGCKQEFNTIIYLPFKKSITNTEALCQQVFDAVNQDLILFLNKIRKVNVLNGTNKKNKIIIKDQIHDNLISIACNDSVSRWIYYSENVFIDHKLRNNKIKITLAMKLQDNKDKNYIKIPHIEPLYCYLPLRTYGFRFAINAPFELTSSRESLHDESEWNILILTNISGILPKILNLFKSHIVNDQIHNYWFVSFINYLPDPMDFFQSPLDYISKSMLSSLKKYPIIPCINDNFHPPGKCIILPQFLRPYFDISSTHYFASIDIFTKLMGLYVVDINIESCTSEGSSFINILKSLGVSIFCISHFFEFIIKLFNSSKEVLTTPSKMGICLTILMQLYSNVRTSEKDLLSREFNALCDLPIFPLIDNTFVSTSTSIVNIIYNEDKYSEDILSLICQFFKFIHPCTVSLVQENIKDKFTFAQVTKDLNIHIWDQYNTLESLVIQFYDKKDHALKDNVKMLSYLCDLWKKAPKKVNINLILERGFVFCEDLSVVYLVEQIYIKNSVMLSLQKEFVNTTWINLHESYILNEDLLDFLKVLNVLEFPYPVKRLINKSLSLNKDGKNIFYSCSSLLEANINIENYTYDLTNTNLVDIVLNGNYEERVLLSKLLDDYYDQYFSVLSTYSKNSDASNTISSLSLLLSFHPWLPTIDGNKSCKPSRVFNRTLSICNFLGPPTYSLVSAYLFNNSKLIKLLNIRCELSFACLSIIFKHWTSLSPFVSSLPHIFSIYRELNNSFSKNPEILKNLLLKETNLIYVTNNKIASMDSKNTATLIEGFFVSSSAVFYDEEIFSGKYLKYNPLSNIYESENLKSFFVDLLKVPEEPSFEEYLTMFSTHFCSSEQVYDLNCLHDVLSKLGLKCLKSLSTINNAMDGCFLCSNISELYDHIQSQLNPLACESVVRRLKYIPCIQTHSNKLATPSTPNLFFCDDSRLRDIFISINEISLVKMDDDLLSQTIIRPSKRLVGIICFFIACGIPKLSSKCSIIVDDSFSKFVSNSNWSYTLSAAFPYLYVYISMKYPNLSELLLKKQVWESVQKVEFIEHTSDTISVHFSIDSIRVVKPFNAFCAIHPSGSVMHTLSSTDFAEYLRGYYGNQTIEEFLRVLDQPSPSLCRELASFIREIIITPSEQLPYLINRCGFEAKLFYSNLKDSCTKSFLPSCQERDFATINYKVRYNETNIEKGDSNITITPVVNPQTIVNHPNSPNTKGSVVKLENDKYIQIPKHLNMNAYSNRVGRWGEEVINQMLRSHKTLLNNPSTSIIEVDWVNEQVESMLPYDFIIKTKHLEVEKSIFIEVKASSNPKSESFEVSIKEIEFAIRCGSNYHLYKVSPKGYKKSSELLKEDDCDIKIYENLAHHFRKKFIRLVGIIK